MHRIQRWELIVDPRNPRRWVNRLGSLTQRICGLDGHNLVVLFGKPGCVASRAGADIEDQQLRAWE
jgi:hypothetical protein